MPSKALQQKLEKVLSVLRENNHEAVAAQLEAHAKALQDPVREQAALREIRGLCHVRALGDLYIQTLELKEWLKLLEQLGSLCAKA